MKMILFTVATTVLAHSALAAPGFWCQAQCIAQNTVQVEVLGSVDGGSARKMDGWHKTVERCNALAKKAGYTVGSLVLEGAVIDQSHRRVVIFDRDNESASSQDWSSKNSAWAAAYKDQRLFRRTAEAAAGASSSQSGSSSSYSHTHSTDVYDVEDSVHLEVKFASPGTACEKADYDPYDDVPVVTDPNVQG